MMQPLASPYQYYNNEDPSKANNITHKCLVGLACFVTAAVVTFVAARSNTTELLTAPRLRQSTVAIPGSMGQFSRVHATMNNDFGIPKSNMAPVSQGAEAPADAPAAWAPPSLKWMAAAVISASVLPLVSLFKRWSTQDAEEDDEDDTESIAEEASWAIATVIGVTAAAPSATLQVKDLTGSPVGTAELSLRTAGENSRHVIHRKLVAELANKRQGTAHTKTRGETAYSGRKPYKQKKTGNARRGGNRSPLVRGGGTAFGPRNTRNWKQKINKKEGRLAISSLLQNRAPLITVVKDLESAMNVISTKKAAELINSWKDESKDEKVLLVVDMPWNAEHPLVLSTRNMPKVRLMNQLLLSVTDLLWPNQIFMSEKALEGLKARFEETADEDSEVEAPPAPAAV